MLQCKKHLRYQESTRTMWVVEKSCVSFGWVLLMGARCSTLLISSSPKFWARRKRVLQLQPSRQGSGACCATGPTRVTRLHTGTSSMSIEWPQLSSLDSMFLFLRRFLKGKPQHTYQLYSSRQF